MKKHRIRILPDNKNRRRIEVLEYRKFWFISYWMQIFTATGGPSLIYSYRDTLVKDYNVNLEDVEDLTK